MAKAQQENRERIDDSRTDSPYLMDVRIKPELSRCPRCGAELITNGVTMRCDEGCELSIDGWNEAVSTIVDWARDQSP